MPVKVICEIASNWNGDVNQGKALITKAKQAGAWAVKFQMWRAADLYTPQHPNWVEIVKAQLTKEKALQLYAHAQTEGIPWSASCFYPEALDFLVKELKVPFLKIAAPHRAKQPLQNILDAALPTFASVTSWSDFNDFLSNAPKPDLLTPFLVVSKYPASLKDFWRVVNGDNFLSYSRIRTPYGNFGYSNHVMPPSHALTSCLLMASLGASFLEVHFRDENSLGPDVPVSLTPGEVKALIQEMAVF